MKTYKTNNYTETMAERRNGERLNIWQWEDFCDKQDPDRGLKAENEIQYQLCGRDFLYDDTETGPKPSFSTLLKVLHEIGYRRFSPAKVRYDNGEERYMIHCGGFVARH